MRASCEAGDNLSDGQRRCSRKYTVEGGGIFSGEVLAGCSAGLEPLLCQAMDTLGYENSWRDGL